MSKEAVRREREPGGGEAAAGAGRRRAAVRARCPRRLPVCRAHHARVRRLCLLLDARSTAVPSAAPRLAAVLFF